MDDLISRQSVMHALEKCHKQCCRENDGGDEWIHYETTVNELECIPPTQPNLQPTCNQLATDTISRQAAIDQISRWLGYLDDDMILRIQIGLRKLPSAQPECKTGHWVSQNGGGYCCSECGRYALDEVDGNFIHVAFKSNFCPYCGADMSMRGDSE